MSRHLALLSTTEALSTEVSHCKAVAVAPAVKANGQILSVGKGSERALQQGRRDESQPLWQVLKAWRAGKIQPVLVSGIGPLWRRATPAARALHSFVSVCFGLRLADGFDDPMMLACSVLVDEKIVTTVQGASYLLRDFERRGVIWSPGPMSPIRGKRDGTKLWLPGIRPDGPEPPDGWLSLDLRVFPADECESDDAPGAGIERGAVAVEAERVDRDVAVEPTVERPHQALVSDAVCGSTSLGLDRFGASLDAADSHVTDGNPAVGAEPVESIAVSCMQRERHAGREWRRSSAHPWQCGACQPPAAGVPAEWRHAEAQR
jgi:hypothetical protein